MAGENGSGCYNIHGKIEVQQLIRSDKRGCGSDGRQSSLQNSEITDMGNCKFVINL